MGARKTSHLLVTQSGLWPASISGIGAHDASTLAQCNPIIDRAAANAESAVRRHLRHSAVYALQNSHTQIFTVSFSHTQ